MLIQVLVGKHLGIYMHICISPSEISNIRIGNSENLVSPKTQIDQILKIARFEKYPFIHSRPYKSVHAC